MEEIIHYLSFLAILTAFSVIFLLINEYVYWKRKLDFATEYLYKLTQFGNLILKNEYDDDLYVWLTQNEPEIQIDVGVLGVHGKYKVISNTIPMLALVGHGRNSYADMYEAETQFFNCKHVLNRYIGVAKKNFQEAKHALINPIKWIHTAILIPFRIFQWLGFNSNYINKLETNPFIKLISSLFVLLQIVAAVITIWDFINLYL